MWLCDSRTSTAERVGEGSSPRSSASPVSIRLNARLVGIVLYEAMTALNFEA